MASTDEDHPAFAELKANLTARGLWQHVRIDATIVRGLAYYTGVVFEVFDLKHGLRALAGGGTYDKLCALISDGNVDHARRRLRHGRCRARHPAQAWKSPSRRSFPTSIHSVALIFSLHVRRSNQSVCPRWQRW
jgi:hypothetical protein